MDLGSIFLFVLGICGIALLCAAVVIPMVLTFKGKRWDASAYIASGMVGAFLVCLGCLIAMPSPGKEASKAEEAAAISCPST